MEQTFLSTLCSSQFAFEWQSCLQGASLPQLNCASGVLLAGSLHSRLSSCDGSAALSTSVCDARHHYSWAVLCPSDEWWQTYPVRVRCTCSESDLPGWPRRLVLSRSARLPAPIRSRKAISIEIYAWFYSHLGLGQRGKRRSGVIICQIGLTVSSRGYNPALAS